MVFLFIYYIIANNIYMLDYRSSIVLKYLVNECKEGSYKIIDIDDIVLSMPKKFKADKEIILQIMEYLSNGEYISVKYSDDDQFCLCPLPFGRQFVEKDQILNKNKKIIQIVEIKYNLLTFFFAFMGAFLAIIIYNLIF